MSDAEQDKPPLPSIARLLKQGEVIPFLGAGVHRSNRAANSGPFKGETSPFYPLGNELATFLADDVTYPEPDARDRGDLAKVTSYYVDVLARRRLREQLRAIFDRDCDPPDSQRDIHAYLADVAPPLAITTNYDDALERAFEAKGKPHDVVVYPADQLAVAGSVLVWRYRASEPVAVATNALNVDFTDNTVIFKMHGTVHRDRRTRASSADAALKPPRSGPRAASPYDSYVITEDDYVDFLSRFRDNAAVPATIMEHCSTRHLLFLGYGLGDWNLRVVLKGMKELLRQRSRVASGTSDPTDLASQISLDRDTEEIESWAIQLNPSVLERRLWGKRDVTIYNMDLGDFVAGLRAEQ